LVPIDGAGAKKLTDKYGFFSQSAIPSGTYENVGTTSSVAVGAQWFTSAKEDEELIYKITKALWNDESRKLNGCRSCKRKNNHTRYSIIRSWSSFASWSRAFL
jgi:TRAP-type uncharacterized transport system substrate-binding protein